MRFYFSNQHALSLDNFHDRGNYFENYLAVPYGYTDTVCNHNGCSEDIQLWWWCERSDFWVHPSVGSEFEIVGNHVCDGHLVIDTLSRMVCDARFGLNLN